MNPVLTSPVLTSPILTTTILHALSLLSATVTSALFSAIWEGTVVVAIALVCLRSLPGLNPASRSLIWLNVFALTVLLNVLPAFEWHHTMTASPGRPAPLHLDLRWSFAIAAVWAALSMWRAAQLVAGAIHLRGMARRAVPIATDASLQALLHDSRSAELCSSSEVARPSVCGFFRPRILMPPVLVERLSALELQQVVLHEMEHLRRADDWTNLLQKLGLVLFPLNPVLLWVERRLCVERELACDDRVLRSSAGRKAYAMCLTRLAEYAMLQRSFSLVLGAWERRPELVRRVQRILRQPGQSMGRKPAMAATTGLVAGALACALTLAHSPQLVTFVPAAQPSHSDRYLAPGNFRELSREVGGAPHLVNAVLPQPRLHSATKPHRARMREARRSTTQHLILAQMPNRVRDPILDPILERPTLLLLTEWNYIQGSSPVMIRLADDSRSPHGAIHASYAAVPTPGGWLIIQI